MHCALQRTCSNTRKFSDRENNSISRKSWEENNFRESSNDCEVSSLAWRNSDHRCSIFTFVALEPDGQWRIVALPLECPDHTIHLGSRSQVKMDGLHLVSPSLVSSVRVDQQNTRRGPATERSCSVKSFPARSFSGSKFQYESRNNGLANKVSRRNALPGNSSCQTSFNSGDSSVMIPSGSNATNSSDIHIDISQVDNTVKRNSKKKGRKKGKRNKKLSCDTGSTDQECIHGSSTSDIGISKNTDCGIGRLPYPTRLALSLPEHSSNGNDSEGNSSGSGTINYSETPKTCTSLIDGVDVLEANCIGENPLSNRENGVQTFFPEFSILNGVQDTHSKPLSCCNDPCSSVFSEANDSSALDSISVCSNGNECRNTGYHVKLSNKESGGSNLSEPSGYIAIKGSRGTVLNGVVDSYCHAGGTTSCGQGCTSGEMAKGGKQTKRVSKNSSVSRLSNVGKFYGRSGKENGHSIWQKVQRNDTDECSYGLRKVSSADSESGVGLKEVKLLKKNCYVAQSSILSTCEDKNQSKVKASRKLKRKTSPGSKQELNYYSRKGPCATTGSSNVCMKINIQQNEGVDIPALVDGQKGSNGGSRSRAKIGCPRIGFQTKRVESITFEPVYSLEGCPSELEPLEHVSATLSSLNDQTAQRESSSLSGFCDHRDQTELLEEQSTGFLHPPGGEEGPKIDNNFSPVEHSKQDHSSGSILQKWMPVGIKDSELVRSGHSNSLQMANINKPEESCTLENTAREMASDPSTFASINASVMCTVNGSTDDNGLHSENEVEIKKRMSWSTCTPKESCVNSGSAKCLIRASKDQNNSAVENYSKKIAQAVNDAFRVQLASEAVQMATGGPIAEFERLLYSASPVISLPHNILSCQTCLSDEEVAAPLCRHERPNISLGSLWQWYEKHGTYGLEVRAEDYENSKRLGIDRFAFRAYFVPFLSAVQLFRNHKSHPSNVSNRIPGTKGMDTCKLGERSENSSNIGCLPIFSVLVPRPHIEDTSSPSPRNCPYCSETSSVYIEGNATIQLDDSTSSDDVELLFEYFEVDQPQQRRPLFEMIKELVRGDGASQCRAYGDPSKLDSVAVNDLHPKSWYSVAWYPIYRIPDGNFRAAFLTYHSLGHLVRRSATSDSAGVGASVVSPVVGLQSYNAQGECWFQLRESALSQTTEIPNFNPSGILKERLRTLEQAASLMARAVVTKGSLTSVNRQPDYEFFLSRRPWFNQNRTSNRN